MPYTVDEPITNALLEIMVACDRAKMYHYPAELQAKLLMLKRATIYVRQLVREFKP